MLYKCLWSHGQDGRHAHIHGQTLQNHILWNQSVNDLVHLYMPPTTAPHNPKSSLWRVTVDQVIFARFLFYFRK